MSGRIILIILAGLQLPVTAFPEPKQRDTKATINSIGRKRAASKPPARRPSGGTSARRNQQPRSRDPRTRTAAPSPAPLPMVVSAGGGGRFRTISEALARAKPGETITVRPGVYRETLDVKSSVTLVSESDAVADATVIEGKDSACAILREGSQLSLKGFTLRCAEAIDNSGPGYTVEIPSGRLVLTGCIVLGGDKGAIRVAGSNSTADLHLCKVKARFGPAILFTDKAGGTVERCSLIGGRPAAIQIISGSDPTFRDCKITDSPQFGVQSVDARGKLLSCHIKGIGEIGVVSEGSSNLFVSGGSISECRDGAQARYGAQLRMEDVEVHHTRYTGISAAAKGTSEIKECHVHDVTTYNGIHADGEGTVIIQGGEVNNIAKSGISANQKSHISATKVTVHDIGWEGFTVTGGSDSVMEDCDISTCAACGIGVLGGAKATVVKCKITSSKRHGIGLTPDASVFVRESVIENNAMGGISSPDPKRVVITDSRVQK